MKVGIIGLGEVAQLMHIHVLHDMWEDFTVTAVVDVSPSITAHIAEKYNVKDTFSDAGELIKKSDADVIFVLSPDQYHSNTRESASLKWISLTLRLMRRLRWRNETSIFSAT